jgi:hypothetical protein
VSMADVRKELNFCHKTAVGRTHLNRPVFAKGGDRQWGDFGDDTREGEHGRRTEGIELLPQNGRTRSGRRQEHGTAHGAVGQTELREACHRKD